MHEIPVHEVIDLLGGTTAVARFLDIQPPSVSEWLRRGQIPADKRVLLAPRVVAESGGRYQRWDVCPDTWHRAWPELIGTPGAPPAPEGLTA